MRVLCVKKNAKAKEIHINVLKYIVYIFLDKYAGFENLTIEETFDKL